MTRPVAKNRNSKYCSDNYLNTGVDLLMSFPIK